MPIKGISSNKGLLGNWSLIQLENCVKCMSELSRPIELGAKVFIFYFFIFRFNCISNRGENVKNFINIQFKKLCNCGPPRYRSAAS